MTTPSSQRWTRLRDLALTTVTSVCALLAGLLFTLHSLQQTSNVVGIMLGGRTLLLGASLAGVAVAAGLLYVLLPSPCHAAPGQRIRDSAGS